MSRKHNKASRRRVAMKSLQIGTILIISYVSSRSSISEAFAPLSQSNVPRQRMDLELSNLPFFGEGNNEEIWKHVNAGSCYSTWK